LADEGQCGRPQPEEKKENKKNAMKTKLFILSAALFCAASLSANAALVYGEVLPAPAPACAPAVVTCGHPDRRDVAHYNYDRHDYRYDHNYYRR
jgi:hypothetical protein